MLVNTHLLKLKLVMVITILIFTTNSEAQNWSLKQWIDTALVHNKTLKIAQGDIEIANERNKEAKGGLVPKLYGNIDYRYYTDLQYQLLPASVFGGPTGVYKEAQFGVPHNLNANLTLDVPLYNPQAIGAITVSKRAKELNQIQFQQTEEQVVFDVSNFYYNAQLVSNQIVFIKNGLSNSEKLLSNIKLLYSQQMAKGTDVDKIKLQQSQLNTQLSKANAQYQQIINLLKLQLGITPSRPITIEETYSTSSEAVKYTTKPTSDILLFNTKQQLLKSELKTLKLSHLPSFSLYGTYGTAGFGNYSGTNDFFKTYPIGFAGVKMSWMIFSGTTLEYKVFQKREEIKQNTTRLELLNDKQNVQIENAQMQFEVASSNLLNAKSQLALAETIYSKTLIQQKEGVASLTDVLLSDNTQKEAQQNYLSALVDVMKADLELKKVSGNILKTK
ncbi:MAG: TolC family protein [Sphingobacteriaceae bacterium]|nr:TolC family protein [Sphingobacteriaceae bacterium]